MKKYFIFMSVLLIFFYFQNAVNGEETTPTQTMGEPLSSLKDNLKPLFGNLLSNINVSGTSFNPQHGGKADISFNLSAPARVSVHIYDADRELIKTIITDKSMAQGDRKTAWDGKDMDGNVVPDEAYFFTISARDEAGVEEIYDPTTFSGGIEHDITSADINQENGTINYKMPEMGRVLIRIGTEGGPLLNTLVDWKPRVKGMITEYWNGKDKDNVIDLFNHPKVKMIISYFSLPDNSVITYGNKKLTYRDYKKSFIVKRPVKEERASSIEKPSHHFRLPRTADYSPGIKMEFINVKETEMDGTVILKDRTMVKVELDEQDKVFFINQQFEIVFFLDNEFYAEDEAGYTPFNWVWDLSNVKEGEHIFTVNLSGFKDQIGVLSRKVKVIK